MREILNTEAEQVNPPVRDATGLPVLPGDLVHYAGKDANGNTTICSGKVAKVQSQRTGRDRVLVERRFRSGREGVDKVKRHVWVECWRVLRHHKAGGDSG